MRDAEFQASFPRRFHQVSNGDSQSIPYFSAIDGFIDILLPSMATHAAGAITAISNVVPVSGPQRCSIVSSDVGDSDHA